jgi:hypothetical protein
MAVEKAANPAAPKIPAFSPAKIRGFYKNIVNF